MQPVVFILFFSLFFIHVHSIPYELQFEVYNGTHHVDLTFTLGFCHHMCLPVFEDVKKYFPTVANITEDVFVGVISVRFLQKKKIIDKF